MRQMLPVLLKRFAQITDPRHPNKLKHRLTVLMIYGLLVFVFQYGSRRAANREITRPMFEANLRALFPELDTPRMPIPCTARCVASMSVRSSKPTSSWSIG